MKKKKILKTRSPITTDKFFEYKRSIRTFILLYLQFHSKALLEPAKELLSECEKYNNTFKKMFGTDFNYTVGNEDLSAKEIILCTYIDSMTTLCFDSEILEIEEISKNPSVERKRKDYENYHSFKTN